MSKKKTETISQSDFEAELQSQVPEKTTFNPDTVTLGISKTKTGYAIIKTMIDSVSLIAGTPEILDTAENKLEANEKFKINVIKLGIL